MNTSYPELFINNGINPEKIRVVAFDVFDTLVFRKVSPMQVHRLWAEQLIEKFQLSNTVEQLVKKKFECARIAKIENICNGKDPEYKYHQMTDILLRRLKVTATAEQFYKCCLGIEIEVEKKVCYIPKEVRELVLKIQMEKNVICISDFYIPAISLKEILSSKGLDIKGVFVSSDYLLQKRTGRLFSSVLTCLNIPADQIVMIGDTRPSDIKNAQKKGMKAIFVPNKEQHNYYNAYERKIMEGKKRFQQFLKSDEVVKRQIPFSHVAFLMYVFISRLYKELRKDNCRHVLFMSREGEFFKKIFDTYQNKYIPFEKRIQTHYFYVSRRATLVPSIHRIDKEEFQGIYKNYPKLSVKDFLKNLGLDKNNDLLCSLKSMDIDNAIYDYSKSEAYEAVLDNPVFQKLCLDEAQKQRELFIKYLDDMGIDFRSTGLFLVDVGYSGTSQDNIYKVLDGCVKIYGYYMFSYAEAANISDRNIKKGIIYDIKSGKRKDCFTYNSSVIEMLSLASHGGVDSYKLDQGKVVPEFHENEQELICYRNVIIHVQNTIINEFVKIANMIKEARLDENTYYVSFRKQYKRFIFNPTIEEMEQYLTIPFVDNFAIYRQYIPAATNNNHKFFSFHGLLKIVTTKGKCVGEQNTHWIAAALYKLNMRCLNPVLYIFSNIAMGMFDLMGIAARRRRGLRK